MLTPEIAKEIQEAFGPCTRMYECMEISDLIEDYNQAGLSIRQWTELWMKVEGIYWERYHDARAAGGIEDDWDETKRWHLVVSSRVFKCLDDLGFQEE